MLRLIKIVLDIIIIFLIMIISKNNLLLSQDEKPMFIGNFRWNQWIELNGWSNVDDFSYNPSQLKVEKIKELLSGSKYSFLIFAGSWCGDTKSELPKIFKLFKLAAVETDSIPIYGLDRQKSEPTGISLFYQIERVPTLIITSEKKEIGRITEFPELSWEDDIIRILENQ